LELTEANFKTVTQLIEKTINFGVVLSVCKDNGKINSYEFLSDKKLNENDIKNIFYELQQSSGKTTFPCKLVCSDFLGSNTLSVNV
jgi:hypothetical protein